MVSRSVTGLVNLGGGRGRRSSARNLRSSVAPRLGSRASRHRARFRPLWLGRVRRPYADPSITTPRASMRLLGDESGRGVARAFATQVVRYRSPSDGRSAHAGWPVLFPSRSAIDDRWTCAIKAAAENALEPSAAGASTSRFVPARGRPLPHGPVLCRTAQTRAQRAPYQLFLPSGWALRSMSARAGTSL